MYDCDNVYSFSHVIIYCNICRVYVSFTDILFTLSLFVNFMAYRATLKNRVIYSECATLYKCLNKLGLCLGWKGQ